MMTARTVHTAIAAAMLLAGATAATGAQQPTPEIRQIEQTTTPN